MERRFFTTGEVAEFLRINPRTLKNYGSKHEVYRPCRPGIWYFEHVKLLERVWAGGLSEDEGLAYWTLIKARMRELVRLEAEKPIDADI